MSNLVFPHLPGADMAVERTTLYSSVTHQTESGKRQTTLFEATPRYRYKVKINFLRDAVAAPAPFAASSELGIAQGFFDTHWGSFDSFLFVDPISGLQVRVRFSENTFTVSRLYDRIWSCAFELEQVK